MGLGVGLDDRDRKYSRYYGGQVFFSRKLTKRNKLKQYPEDIKLGENDFQLFVQKKKEPQNPKTRCRQGLPGDFQMGEVTPSNPCVQCL